MKNLSSFLIVCLVGFFTACKAPQQVVSEKTIYVTKTDTVLVSVPVPVYRDTGTQVIPGLANVDSLFFQWEKSWAQVTIKQDTATKKRTYTVAHGNEPDTVQIPVVVTVHDTIRVQMDCPPTLPAMPKGGKFPWLYVILAMGALSVWWAGKKVKR